MRLSPPRRKDEILFGKTFGRLPPPCHAVLGARRRHRRYAQSCGKSPPRFLRAYLSERFIACGGVARQFGGEALPECEILCRLLQEAGVQAGDRSREQFKRYDRKHPVCVYSVKKRSFYGERAECCRCDESVASAPRDGTCQVPDAENGVRLRLSFRLRQTAAYGGVCSHAHYTGGETSFAFCVRERVECGFCRRFLRFEGVCKCNVNYLA